MTSPTRAAARRSTKSGVGTSQGRTERTPDTGAVPPSTDTTEVRASNPVGGVGEAAGPGSSARLPRTSADPGTRRRRTYTAGGLLVALVAVAAALYSSGAAAPSALLDPGAVVRWGLPAVTVGVHAAAALTLGAFACCATILPRGGRTGGEGDEAGGTDGRPGSAWIRAAQIGTLAAIAWTLLQAARLVLAHAAMLGLPLGAAEPGTLVEFITATEAGGMLAWSVILTALVAVLAVLVTSAAGAAGVFVVAAIALAPFAGGGHASSGGNHTLAVSAMWLHLLGFGLWVGGLVVLMMTGAGSRLRTVVGRYSVIAGWGFAIVFASGLANAVIRLNGPAELLTTAWGQLLVFKSVAFLALGIAGYAHREYVLRHWPQGGAGVWHRALFWRLAGVEILSMGAIVGVSVALGSTEPPVPQDQQQTNEFTELTGYPVPPEMTWQTLTSQWQIEPVLLLAAVAAVVVYVRWVLRLYRRGDDWPLRRTVCWLLGMGLFIWATSGGLQVYANVQFSVHMAQHMLLMMFLPILYVVAAPGALAYRALPARRDGTKGPREYLLALMHSRPARFLTHPVTAALNVVVSMAVFYLTPLFEFALGSHMAHLLMVVHFSLAGYIFINILIGIDPGPRRPFYPLRLVLLLPSMVFHTFFGLGLVSSSQLLAAPYYARLQWVADPLADQQIAGALAWGTGELPVLALAVVIALKWVQADTAREGRERRRLDPTARPTARPAARAGGQAPDPAARPEGQASDPAARPEGQASDPAARPEGQAPDPGAAREASARVQD